MPQTEKGGAGQRLSKKEQQEAANRLESVSARQEETPSASLNINPSFQLDASQVEDRRNSETITGALVGAQRVTPPNTIGGLVSGAAEVEPPEGVELIDPRSLPDQVPAYADEVEEFLFGMTSRPNEPVNFGVTSRAPVAPKKVYKYLQTLAQAAEDPDAPEQLFAFIRLLQDMLTEEPSFTPTLGTGPGRRGQMERPLTLDEGGPGDPPLENRIPPAGS